MEQSSYILGFNYLTARMRDPTTQEVMLMLMRYEPFREFDRLASTFANVGRMPSGVPMDAYRQGDELHLHVDLPGVDTESIELTVEKNVLTVTARRMFDRSQADHVIVSERPQGMFRRQILLGEGLDTDALEASHDNGVLAITVPVRESAKPRRVEIGAGSPRALGTSDRTDEHDEELAAADAA